MSFEQIILFGSLGFCLYGIFSAYKKLSQFGRLRPSNSKDQIKLVTKAEFSSKKLMNGFEFRTYQTVTEWAGTDYLVFAQVNLGEFLRTKDYKAFQSINSKRVDLLVINRRGDPVFAIECQGSGHFQSNAGDRDKVKALALKAAGIPLVEVFEKDKAPDLKKRFDEARPGIFSR